MSLIERAGKAVAVELGYCDPDEWGTDECNRDDRDTALRAAGAALDAASCEGAVEALRAAEHYIEAGSHSSVEADTLARIKAALSRLGGQ